MRGGGGVTGFFFFTEFSPGRYRISTRWSEEEFDAFHLPKRKDDNNNNNNNNNNKEKKDTTGFTWSVVYLVWFLLVGYPVSD